MDWDAFNVQVKDRENRKIFRYPKYERTGFFAYKQIYFYFFAT